MTLKIDGVISSSHYYMNNCDVTIVLVVLRILRCCTDISKQ